MKGTLVAEAIFSRRKQSILEVLKGIELFQGLSTKDLKKIMRVGYIRNNEKNELVFRKGDPSYGMYIILRGEMNAYLKRNKKEWSLAKIHAGEYFGEIAFSKDAKRAANCKATEKSTVLYIFAKDMKRLFKQYPKIGFVVYENVLARLYSFLEFAEEEFLRLRDKRR